MWVWVWVCVKEEEKKGGEKKGRQGDARSTSVVVIWSRRKPNCSSTRDRFTVAVRIRHGGIGFRQRV